MNKARLVCDTRPIHIHHRSVPGWLTVRPGHSSVEWVRLPDMAKPGGSFSLLTRFIRNDFASFGCGSAALVFFVIFCGNPGVLQSPLGLPDLPFFLPQKPIPAQNLPLLSQVVISAGQTFCHPHRPQTLKSETRGSQHKPVLPSCLSGLRCILKMPRFESSSGPARTSLALKGSVLHVSTSRAFWFHPPP